MKQRLLRDLPLLFLVLLLGTGILALVVRLVGASPVAAAKALWFGAFGSSYSLSETLVQTTPLLLTGLGVAVAFRSGLFNIGAEGQFLVGAMAATWIGTMKTVPAPVHLPLVLVAGAVAGGFWAGIAGLLKVYRGVQEVLPTLLLNFVALQTLSWMVRGPLQEAEKGFPQSDAILIPARLVVLLPHTRLHAGVIFALFCAVAVWFLLKMDRGRLRASRGRVGAKRRR